jgi:protein-disulfide isomerase
MQFRTMARTSVLVFGIMALAAPAGFSQNPADRTPEAPEAPAPAGPAQQSHQLSLAPGPDANANPFPPADPRNFTANSPGKQTIDDFLKASWGYDPNRMWQVQAILKTQVPGVSRVVVLVAEKGAAKQQPAQLAFFSLPDGKHIIADTVLPFGSKPFEDNRQLLEREATGPSRGATSKDLEIIEFADFECPVCKAAQPTISKLLNDYPGAHFVYQNFPLVQVHSEAYKAASYGVCVAKLGGNATFFKFGDAVFDSQAGLTPGSSDQTLKDAVTKAGGDPDKVAACSATPETKAAVDASLKLGDEIGVASTPTLLVNGRVLPLGGIEYETLRKIIDFQAEQDGVNLPPRSAEGPAPSLK